VLLRVETNDERWDIDELLANPDVTLTNEDASVMDRLGETEFENLRLQAALEEVFDAKTQNVIEFHFRFVQNSDPDQTAEKGVAFEESPGVFLLEREQDARGFSDLCEGEFNAPYLAFVAETELSDELQLLVEALLLERTTRRRIRLRSLGRQTRHFLK